jgi:hypothetical protein
MVMEETFEDRIGSFFQKQNPLRSVGAGRRYTEFRSSQSRRPRFAAPD